MTDYAIAPGPDGHTLFLHRVDCPLIQVKVAHGEPVMKLFDCQCAARDLDVKQHACLASEPPPALRRASPIGGIDHQRLQAETARKLAEDRDDYIAKHERSVAFQEAGDDGPPASDLDGERE